MSIIVRRADYSDAAELSALASVTFALACPPGSSPEAIDHFIEHHLTERHFDEYLVDPDRVTLIAEDVETPVGYTMLIFGEPSDADAAVVVTLRPTVELNKVYVLESAHGGAVAGPLLEETLAVARGSHAKSIWLGVNEHNARAIRFYEKNGFEKLGTKSFSLGSTIESDYVMHRVL